MGEWQSEVATWKRRQKLCLGYIVKYQEETRTYRVYTYSVQNGRTPALLGGLEMGFEEWSIFHAFIYERLEDLNPPIKEDNK